MPGRPARIVCAIASIFLAPPGPVPARADDLPRLPDGRLEAGCDYLADAPRILVEMEFVGGIQFSPGGGSAEPKDATAAVESLRVGELQMAGETEKLPFLEKRPVDHGFVVRWARRTPPGDRVALYTSWASLKDTTLRPRNILCRERADGAPASP